MGKVLSIAGQKGGIGKTTTVVNLAAGLASRGKGVLVIDLDPQYNLTTYLCCYDEKVQKNAKTLMNVFYYNRKHLTFKNIILKPKIGVSNTIIKDEINSIEILPEYKGIDLIANERRFYQISIKDVFRIKNELDTLITEYDYILIDCPPALSHNTIAAFVASDYVLTTINSDIVSIEAYYELVTTINNIQQNRLNPNVKFLGTYINAFDPENEDDKEILEQCITNLGSLFIDIQINREHLIKKAMMDCIPCIWYKNENIKLKFGVDPVKSYNLLIDEILKRVKANE